jgi:hypothetical protein
MNERTIVIENVANQLVGLVDIQGRVYNLQPTQKVRVSKLTVQDILDVPGNRKIFNRGLAKIKNASKQDLFSMGLTEDEIEMFAEVELEKETPIVVITDSIVREPSVVETIEIAQPEIEVAEKAPSKEEAVIEVKKDKPTTTKKSSTKTSSKSTKK